MYRNLKNIINSDILNSIDQNDGCVKLKEDTAPRYENNPILLGGLHKDTVVVKLDKIQSNYLNKKYADINKSCDYVLFSGINNKNYAIFIELKSRKGWGTKQIKYSIPFVKYLEAILTEETGNPKTFEQIYVVFKASGRLAKQKTKNIKIKTEKIDNRSIKIINKPHRINIAKLIS